MNPIGGIFTLLMRNNTPVTSLSYQLQNILDVVLSGALSSEVDASALVVWPHDEVDDGKQRNGGQRPIDDEPVVIDAAQVLHREDKDAIDARHATVGREGVGKELRNGH